ncbi:hypothetical protein Vretimale_7844 [Volvox reticuliferus]|uniref:EF-hand domain-containing protein n=1 Tax=Volvox reticuliferus TaxID=1737510 RepID=A0A8J4C898_9CHLO|nr:hypothetical protein Vretifemale_4994 [Volvox reticuliferus]GIM03034.1 hypothetical protein Vretimale_7844 [Volvox reticuliferus]
MLICSRYVAIFTLLGSAAGESMRLADGNGAEGTWPGHTATRRTTRDTKCVMARGNAVRDTFVDPFATAFGVASVPGRRALTSVLDNTTFKWALIALGIVIGLFLLAAIIWAIVSKCGRGRSAPIAPGAASPAKGEGGGSGKNDVEEGPAAGSRIPMTAPSAPGAGAAAPSPAIPPVRPVSPAGPLPPPGAPAGGGPVPPWKSDPQRLPPGIMLAPLTPPLYSPLVSNPRLDTEPPYERLVLISSRVHKPDMVARAVLPNVAYVVYDWKNFTLQELLRYIKKALGQQKVISIAVLAPGSRPGTVGLLEGAGTSPEKLASKTELSQFWRVLAGCVALSSAADGRRVDLLGCRIVEAPREGAALLKELWNLTTVPFAAADDALGGYMLCTFMEEPTTRQLSLISSTIPAIDLYFNRFALLGIPPPGSGGAAGEGGGGGAIAVAASAPLPPGPPPPGAIAPVGTAPPLASAPALAVPTTAAAAAAAPTPAPALASNANAAAPPPSAPAPSAAQAHAPAVMPEAKAAAPLAPLPQASTPPGPEGPDVFSRLSRALLQHGKTPDAAFSEFDRDGNGQLSTAELTELMRVHLPDASPIDIKHFQAMLDTDALTRGQEALLSREEFVKGLPENVRIQEQVRAGRDDDEVVPRLQDYLTENEQILRDTFEQFDANSDGHLDHLELQELVDSIPGLEPREKKFILALLYVHDQNRDLRISLDELLAALRQFGKDHLHRPSVARAVSLAPAAPGATAAATAAATADTPVPAPPSGAGEAHLQQPQKAEVAGAAAPAAAAAPPPPSVLLTPMGPPGGKLAPLSPLGVGGGTALPRPGALAPLGSLPGR